MNAGQNILIQSLPNLQALMDRRERCREYRQSRQDKSFSLSTHLLSEDDRLKIGYIGTVRDGYPSSIQVEVFG